MRLKPILARIVIPIIVLLALYFTGAYIHKIYTDHYTYCNIITKSGKEYVNIRKSSIETKKNTKLIFTYPEKNLRVKIVGDLSYAVICPTNINQQFPIEDARTLSN